MTQLNNLKTFKHFTTLNDLERLTDSYSVSELTEEEQKDIINPTVAEEPQIKSLVIDAFEKRHVFYDDDLSLIIGYILVALSVILLIIGAGCFLGEYVIGETGIYCLDFLA